MDVESECAARSLDTVSNEVLLKESGKMVFLVQLLDELKRTGHRCLVFSQSRMVLDIITKVITERVRGRLMSSSSMVSGGTGGLMGSGGSSHMILRYIKAQLESKHHFAV